MDNEEYDNKYYHYHHRSGIGALILILIGVILLLNNLGILPWELWGSIWRFWPLILIIVGLQLIFGRSRTSRTIILVIAALLVLLAILLADSQYNPALNSWMQQNIPFLTPQHHMIMDQWRVDSDNNPTNGIY